MNISFFGNDRETDKYQNEYLKLSKEVWETGQYLNGPWVKEFEANIAQFSKRKYAVSLSSCTDALIFGLQALNLPENSKVLIPDYSFIASASPVILCGHQPKFIDVSFESSMITPEILNIALDKNPDAKAIIGISLYGAMAPLEQIEHICKERGIHLIEDAAQSFGAHLKGAPAGSFGKFSTLSFDPTKTLHAMGLGGCLLTDDLSIYGKVMRLRLHGRDTEMKFSDLGRKSLLPSIDANILNFKLKEVPEWIKTRQEIAKQYLKAIDGHPLLQSQQAPDQSTHAFHKFVLKCKDQKIRDLLQQTFKDNNIMTRVHYSLPLSHNEVFGSFKEINPNALELSKTSLSLPIFHELFPEEVQKICNILMDFH